MKRRMFLAAASASLLVRPAVANVTLGDIKVTSVSDGSLMLPSNMVMDSLTSDQLGALQSEFDLGDTLTPPCNITLVRTADRTVLIDAGAGPEFMSSAGYALDALDAAGVYPEDVTDVVFTHAHPDHIWGLVDDFDDLTFPEARYMIGRKEWDYWTDPNTVDTIGDARTTFAVGAARRLGRIEDQVIFFDDGEEILPGIAARATYGHTPGHMAFEVRNGANSLMVLGDCIGNHHMALRYPDVFSGSDQDPETGAATRVGLLDQLASEQMQVLGFHLPGNGIGRIERAGEAYRFTPDT